MQDNRISTGGGTVCGKLLSCSGLHAIAKERAIHASLHARVKMVMSVAKNGVDPNALPKKRDLKADAASITPL